MDNSAISIQPKQRQVKDWIIKQVKSGKMPDGSFLPSETDLCKVLKVGRTTVRNAIEELSEEKIILKQQGRRSIIRAPHDFGRNRRMRLAWLSRAGLSGIEEIHFQIYNHLLREAEKNNTDLMFVSLQNKSDMEWFAEHTKSFDGLILTSRIGSWLLSPQVDKKLKSIKNLVVVDHVENNLAKYFVSTDNYLGGKMAAEYLIKQKLYHPVIGIRQDMETFNPVRERMNGFKTCYEEHGLSCKNIKLAWDPENYTATNLRLQTYLEENPETDAFFCVTDYMAIHLLFALKSLNIRIPDDISIIGFDGLPQAAETCPELTTIAQPTKEIARQTFKIILDIQKKKELKSNFIKIKPSLKKGKSVKII
jgi:DNA-binding LacI/PurR family transcriptional regulator